MAGTPQMSGGSGVDVSASVSEASTQGFDNQTGPFNVGGGAATNWFLVGLVAVAALGLVLWFKRKH